MPHEIKGKSRPQITVGFSLHRPEMVPLTFALMQRHDALFLEEPPSAAFNDMLRGAVSIDDYLLPLDVEYPEFSRRMCRRLRKLHTEEKVIVQVEPFLEVLLGIHNFFPQVTRRLICQKTRSSIRYIWPNEMPPEHCLPIIRLLSGDRLKKP